MKISQTVMKSTSPTAVGSSTHDFTVRTDPIMRRLGKTRMPWARGVMLPPGARLSNGMSGFFLGAGGGSRTHFSHPFLDAYYGLLRDVSAARRLSRSAFGGQCQPRPRSPGDFDRACQNRISLLKIKDAQVLTIRVSPAKLPLPLVLQLLLCGHSRSVVFLF